MLSFRQFILEATADHFKNINNFDPANNPEDKDLLDGWNLTPNLPTHKANKIRSRDELRNEAKVGLKKLDDIKKDKEHKLYKESIADGSVEKVYDNPDTGVTVYKPYNAKGCKSVQSGIIDSACVFNPDQREGQFSFDDYDSTNRNSYILHLNKESDSRFTRIAAIGAHPMNKMDGYGFIDKGNVPVSDDEWERLRKQHNLDDVLALNGIRGIPLNKEHRSQELLQNIKDGKFLTSDIQKAKQHGYFHPSIDDELLKAGFAKKLESGMFYPEEIRYAKENNFWDKRHEITAKNGLKKRLEYGNFGAHDVSTAKENGYWDEKYHINSAMKGFSRILNSNHLNYDDISAAHAHGYLTDEHKNILAEHLTHMLSSSKVDQETKNNLVQFAKSIGYWRPEHEKLI